MEHSRQRSVTEEQRSPRPNAAQPEGRQAFFALTSLLAPYRPLRVCSSLAPRQREKFLAADVTIIPRHSTKSRTIIEKPKS